MATPRSLLDDATALDELDIFALADEAEELWEETEDEWEDEESDEWEDDDEWDEDDDDDEEDEEEEGWGNWSEEEEDF